ncbi:MAG: hypothetical protein KJ709_08545 [Nanoarchaeota archaeon]|nr:hypothetical protein [Nanoarchaeota archaeon]
MRRSQIKMGENIAVIFIFFILVAGGLMFYMNIKQRLIQDKFREQQDLMAIELAQKILNLPDLQCTKDNVPVPNCIDSMKIDAVVARAEEDPVGYFRVFGPTEVGIDIIYAAVDPPQNEIHIYGTLDEACPDCTRTLTANMPVTLYSPIQGSYSFAVLKVGVQLR